MANYNQPFQQPVEEEEFDETFSFVTHWASHSLS